MTLQLIQNLVLMATITAAAMSIVLYSAYRSFPKEIQGLGYWSCGAALSVVVGISYGMNAALAGHLTLMIANLAVLLCNASLLLGTLAFFGRRVYWRLFHLSWILAYLGILWFLLVMPDYAMRVVISATYMCAFYGAQLYLIIRYGEKHFSSYFFIFLMSLQTCSVAVNGVNTYMHDETEVSIFTPGLVHTAYVYINTFTALLLGVGFMTVCTQRLQQLLEKRSLTDPLTEALNRRGFAEEFKKNQERTRRLPQTVSLLVLDIDHFKTINDQYGHATGDQVLVHIVANIRKNMRMIDSLARFGGEEFVMLLPNTGLADAINVAQRIQSSLEHTGKSQLPAYTVSIGVASENDPDMQLEQILAQADAALYQAKQTGRNRICVAGNEQVDEYRQ
jgi:diguanylate cyclase (GGDEF)-like protein